MDNEIVLEGSTASWTMPLTQGDLGGSYKGSFTFRCYLNPLQQIASGKEYRSLLGELGSQATNTEGNLAFALVQLKYRIVKAPPFWTATLQDSPYAGNVGDVNIVMLVLEAAIKAEDMFKSEIEKEKTEVLDRSLKVGADILQEKSGDKQ